MPGGEAVASSFVPWVGHTAFRLDADQAAQALVAAEFGKNSLGGDVPQGNSKHDDPPEHTSI